jgi:AraC-like DNA-binding protein
MALSLEQLEGAHRRRTFTYCTDGDPCVLIEVHFAAADAGRWPQTPSAIALGGDFWETTLRAGLLSQNDDASVVAALEDSLRRLSDHGVLNREATARATAAPASPLVRLWSAAKPLVERFAVSSTVDDLVLGTGLSVGQVERAFQHLVSTFALAGPGLRSVTYHVRMKAAVLFLSAKDSTVAEVAELVGYGSSDAMTRAFREAGLPSPSAVQRSLLEDRQSATPM